MAALLVNTFSHICFYVVKKKRGISSFNVVLGAVFYLSVVPFTLNFLFEKSRFCNSLCAYKGGQVGGRVLV